MTRRRDDDRTARQSPDDLPALRDDLRALYGQSPPIPPQLDDAVLDAARRGVLRQARRRVIWLRAAAAAAAAVLAIVAGSWMLDEFRSTREVTDGSPLASRTTGSPLDLDASGRVDILDAFWLARRIGRGAALDDRWDVNADGVVDQADVDRTAREAVRVW